ncbi:MAG: sulfatase [Paenibacillaceae bacterium]|jgi:phosphoglycerol transferase MdoB-like AlkP superfamily enzyme|nr:sulfatase [Paenibacillaceae bacterium]
MVRFPISISKKIIYKSIAISAILIIASVLIGIEVEWISRGSLPETLSWMNTHKAIFALNVLIEGSALAFLYSCIGSLFLSVAAGAIIFSVIAFINYYKSKLVGEPFFPWDIIQRKEGMDVGPLFTGSSDLLRAVLILAIIGILLMLHIRLGKRLSVSWISRLAIGFSAVVVLMSFGLQVSWAKEQVVSAGVDESIWSQQVNYDSNGLMLAFTLNVQHSIITEPENYNAAEIAGITRQFDHTEEAVPVFGQLADQEPVRKQPNVIFIMSEAFWDPSRLTNLSFSSDPVPTVHRLQQERSTGYMLSPQFGGGTSNVEFEVLTGFSMSLLPAGSVPYLQYIDRPVPSLASYFNSRGYKSMAIHSYEGWFWKRNEVYKQLGFADFKSKDNFVDPEYKGPYISDAEVARSIMKEVDETEEPVFIYAVTMQNHSPYTDEARYGEGGNSIRVEGDLTDEAASMLETYTQGAHDADRSLQMLIDHYADSDEPTYIVFYGDHLPTLGLEYDLYRQAGFVGSSNPDDWSLEEYERLRSTPFVTWSNFSVKEEKAEVISSSFVGSYVLNALSMKPEGQFAFNTELYKTAPGLIRNLTVDKDHNLAHTMSSSQESKLEQYKLLQYDLLFGEQYSWSERPEEITE